MDESLMQDFLTESGELIEQLDADLVKLEAADGPEQQEMLNSCFRALHTIKGAASFLGLTNVINFAHAAEDALNVLRKGEADVTSGVMDVLLQSADVVRGMIEQMCAGEEASEGPADLIETLHAIAGGSFGDGGSAAPAAADAQPVAASAPAESTEPAEAAEAAGSEAEDLPGTELNLPPQKADLVEFMVADLCEYGKQLDETIGQLSNDATRGEAAGHLAEIADNLYKTADFFELDDLTRAIKLLLDVAPKMADAPHEVLDEAVLRIGGVKWLILQQAEWLERGRALTWSLDTISERLMKLADGETLPADVAGQHGGDVLKLLLLDGVVDEAYLQAHGGAGDSEDSAEAEPALAVAEVKQDAAPGETAAQADAAPAASSESKEPAKAADARAAAHKPVAEQTIRVEVSRLESLLNLVGQLVLNKNRMLGLTRGLKDAEVQQDLLEDFSGAAGELDQLMGQLQISVMRTRMQPLAKLFDRYPRVIRDVARMTEKQIDLEIEGKDTEVDKSVLEQLADPLVHILRNSADHGVELPADRTAAGKPEKGTIRLTAEHQGSHVRVAIEDDGKGLDREVIGAKAIEKGLTTPEQLAQLSDTDVFRFIFEAGFSTAKQVSDLSGRGVGMDVVRTNINKINGTININSKKGKGTTIEILIPLTVAIMPAMVVGVGKHLYSVPLQCILEIVRPEHVHTIRGHRVIRLRDEVLPLVDMVDRLNETPAEGGQTFAVIVAIGGQKAGLCVDRLIGQQEIVIKPLDDEYTQGGPFSGATIREDGEVSLILDVVKLVRTAASAVSGSTQKKAA